MLRQATAINTYETKMDESLVGLTRRNFPLNYVTAYISKMVNFGKN